MKNARLILVLCLLAAAPVSRAAAGSGGLQRLEPASGCYAGVNLAWGSETTVDFNRQTGWDHVCFVDFYDFPADNYRALDTNLGQVREVGGIYVLTVEAFDTTHGHEEFSGETLRRISEEDCRNLAGWCSYWNQQGVPIIIRFAHEMNGDWYSWRMRPAAYRAAFRRLADAVHTMAPETAMLFAPNVAGSYPYGPFRDITRETYTNGLGSAADWALLDTNGDGVLSSDPAQKDDPYLPFYPGDEYVDWVGMTLYHWGSYYPWWYNSFPEPRKFSDALTGNYKGFNGDDTWNPDFYQEFCAKRGKPLMIPETSAYYRPANPAPPAGYPNYTNDEVAIKSAWMEQLYNVYGDTPNALDIAQHFPKLKCINWFNHYKVESEAQNDTVDWTLTRRPELTTNYYNHLNATRDGRRYFLHAGDLAGYVYDWNSSLEGWTPGGAPFSVTVDTHQPFHGRAGIRIDYDASEPAAGHTVMADFSARQDARDWADYDAILLRARVPSAAPEATFRLAMQSAATNWNELASVACPADGAWHTLTFPYDWTIHDSSPWMNLYLQIDTPSEAATFYVDGLQAVTLKEQDDQP